MGTFVKQIQTVLGLVTSGISAQITDNDFSGLLGISTGGTGLNASGAPSGYLLTGNGSASGFSLVNLLGQSGVSITPTSGKITLGITGIAGAISSGTVLSVGGSGGTTGLTLTGGPITSSGLLTIGGTLGNSNGGTGLNTSGASNGNILIGGVTGFALAPITGQSGISVTNASGSITLGLSGNPTGSVNSVNASGGTTGLDFSGGPITSSGVITMGGTLNLTHGGTGISGIVGTGIPNNTNNSFFDIISPGTSGNFTIRNDGTGGAWANSKVTTGYNYLINGGMDFAQRQTPGTYTVPQFNNVSGAVGSDAYGADQWKIGWQTITINYLRTDTNGTLETGIANRYYGNLKQTASSGKFIMYQPIEGVTTLSLAGRKMTFQCKIKSSINKTVRLGIVQLNSGGTVDTIPAAMVPTTWGVSGTNPTLGSNLIFCSGLTTVPTAANGTIDGNVGLNCAVTTNWKLFGGTFNLASNALNVMPAIWTEWGMNANDVLSVTEAGLYDGAALYDWTPRLPEQEFDLVQRFYEKSHAPDILPASTNAQDSQGFIWFACGSPTTSYIVVPVTYAVCKRTTPNVYTWDSAGNVGKCSTSAVDGSLTDNRTFNLNRSRPQGYVSASDNTSSGKYGLFFAWAADCGM